MQQKQLWYMRRGTEDIRGPFPVGLVSRYILLGRIRQTDELSVDKQQWSLVSELPELIPEVMTPVSDEELEADRLQRLMLAKRWEDERLAGDRRAGKPPLSPSGTPLYNRRSGDRRQPEDAELLRHRIFKTKARKAIRPSRQGYLPQILLAGVILAAAGAMAVFYPTRVINSNSDCNAAPHPGVNWNNCPLEGAVLSKLDLSGASVRNANLTGADLHEAKLSGGELAYTNLSNAKLSYIDLSKALMIGASLRNADLSYANLAGADLSYVDFSGANVGGADFSGAKLDRAIWFDNTVCAIGSRGECLPQTAQQ